MFSQCFSATRLGARLARRVVVKRLEEWGTGPGTRVVEAAGVIVGELAANAVTHGRVPGRDFEVRLALVAGTVRIEVSDTRSERWLPAPGTVTVPSALAERGRGLVLVEALADRWTVVERVPVGKTVRVELDLHGAL
ncbi:regulatory protein [Streptantibioticus cattleyicolor NRRL 8057 = DSM 46488]|uniref:Regulatory protein n=1 Tax=Streptantibioticus cattleyicolor (strain ATCC 35852 / DSM 46488 / JCM 4925 / NBRC 14057 / NRRL 8057) TaxID=1003195 RepID=G8WW87_STREN|nr:regulatory protein [Streptantibioticus cattleyicolor NRRL 8057 = DSM 46488]